SPRGGLVARGATPSRAPRALGHQGGHAGAPDRAGGDPSRARGRAVPPHGRARAGRPRARRPRAPGGPHRHLRRDRLLHGRHQAPRGADPRARPGRAGGGHVSGTRLTGLERWWYAPAPARRLAWLRLLVGGYALGYVLFGFGHLASVATMSPQQ